MYVYDGIGIDVTIDTPLKVKVWCMWCLSLGGGRVSFDPAPGHSSLLLELRIHNG